MIYVTLTLLVILGIVVFIYFLSIDNDEEFNDKINNHVYYIRVVSLILVLIVSIVLIIAYYLG